MGLGHQYLGAYFVIGVIGASAVALSLTLLVVSRGRVAAALRGA
jgi:hypothetical protein